MYSSITTKATNEDEQERSLPMYRELTTVDELVNLLPPNESHKEVTLGFWGLAMAPESEQHSTHSNCKSGRWTAVVVRSITIENVVYMLDPDELDAHITLGYPVIWDGPHKDRFVQAIESHRMPKGAASIIKSATVTLYMEAPSWHPTKCWHFSPTSEDRIFFERLGHTLNDFCDESKICPFAHSIRGARRMHLSVSKWHKPRHILSSWFWGDHKKTMIAHMGSVAFVGGPRTPFQHVAYNLSVGILQSAWGKYSA